MLPQWRYNGAMAALRACSLCGAGSFVSCNLGRYVRAWALSWLLYWWWRVFAQMGLVVSYRIPFGRVGVFCASIGCRWNAYVLFFLLDFCEPCSGSWWWRGYMSCNSNVNRR